MYIYTYMYIYMYAYMYIYVYHMYKGISVTLKSMNESVAVAAGAYVIGKVLFLLLYNSRS